MFTKEFKEFFDTQEDINLIPGESFIGKGSLYVELLHLEYIEVLEIKGTNDISGLWLHALVAITSKGKSALETYEQELAKTEATKSQAKSAKKANLIAWLSLVVSIISLIGSIVAIVLKV